MAEDDKGQTSVVGTPGTVEDDASPAPETAPFKRNGENSYLLQQGENNAHNAQIKGKRRASITELDTRDSRRIRDDSEPVDDDEGPGMFQI